jgi:hypothetical protein
LNTGSVSHETPNEDDFYPLDQVEDDDGPMTHDLGFREQALELARTGTTLDDVLVYHRPYPVSIEISSQDRSQHVVFAVDMYIRLKIVDSVPEFSIYNLINPRKSPNPAQYRKAAIDFTQMIDSARLQGSWSFTFTVSDISRLALTVNSRAPNDIPVSEFEAYILEHPQDCSHWLVAADRHYQDKVVKWGVTFWFSEIVLCRNETVRAARQWAADFYQNLQAELDESFNSRDAFDVNVLFTAHPRQPNRLCFQFDKTSGVKAKQSCVFYISYGPPPFDSEAPRSTIHVQPSEHVGIKHPWLLLVTRIDEASSIIYGTVLNFTNDATIEALPVQELGRDRVSLSLRYFHTSSETTKAVLARAHVYFKLVGDLTPHRESQGISFANTAHIRHNIDFQPLIFPSVTLPGRNYTFPNFNIPYPFPNNTKVLNEAQLQAVSHFEQSTNHITLNNGPPGTGKSLLLAKAAVHQVFNGRKVLVTAANNEALDVLLTKTISTWYKTRPETVKHDPTILRIVAAFRSQLALMTSIENEMTTGEMVNEYSMSNMRVRLVNRIIEENSMSPVEASPKILNDAEFFLNAWDEFKLQGYILDRKESSRFTNLLNHYDKILIDDADLVFVTTSLASSKSIQAYFSPHVIIIDESAFTRDDQVFNAVVWYPSIQLLILAGDPKQLHHSSNQERMSTHWAYLFIHA